MMFSMLCVAQFLPLLLSPETPDLDQVMRELESIRGLTFKDKVNAESQSLEDFGEFLDQELASAYPVQKRTDLQKALVRFGMLPEGADFVTEFRDAMLSQAGAYYDPDSKTFYYLFLDLPEIFMKTIAAHELAHALQDQYFDLNEMLDPIETRDFRDEDALLAMRALIEGEATYTMMIWQANEMGLDITENPMAESMMFQAIGAMDLDQLVSMASAQTASMAESSALKEAMADIETIPKYILFPLYAAYMHGALYIHSLKSEGDGWDAVSDAFENPPVSSEQFMHADRRNDQPSSVPRTAPKPFATSAWSPIDEAVHGEFYLNLWLRELGVDPAIAQAASQGWDGDRYWAFSRGNQVAYALSTIWDSDADAREFLAASISATETRYPDLRWLKRSDSEALYDCGDDLGYGLVSRVGVRVFLVEGAGRRAVIKAVRSLRRASR